MWLLEAAGDDFDGRKLWLRPGNKYLFGRTSNSGERIRIPYKTISRQHLTIFVGTVNPDDGTKLESRSTITLEDHGNKHGGTYINGTNINREKYVLTKDTNTLKFANYTVLFHITWRPIVLGFSLTKVETEQGALSLIQEQLEPLDIKYTTDHRLKGVTHVVSKRRNTSRVLQALVNGQLVVSLTFTDAITQAAATYPKENGTLTSNLEEDFEGSWPDATKYLPLRTDGPGTDQPDEAYAPDHRRKEIFDGFTFVFYERKRFEELLPVITSAKGKALFMDVVPQKTNIDDFIRYVKSVAGEKGLGEFEDGSEGRGVVVVRYVPAGDDDDARWFLNFYNQVALRLDHRPIESRDLLPAILDLEPMQLRRPLEVESTPREQGTQASNRPVEVVGTAMDIDETDGTSVVEETPPPQPRKQPRGRQRTAPKSRFKGFNIDSDSNEDEGTSIPRPSGAPSEASQSMFMTQTESQAPEQTQIVGASSQRKRPAPERDIMEEVAPTAARIKRMRLEGDVDLLPAVPVEEEEQKKGEVPESQRKKTKDKAQTAATPAAKKSKAKKKSDADDSGDELLDQYIQAGQEEEARRQAEEARLRRQLNEGGIDFKEIRDAMNVLSIEMRKRVNRDPEEEHSRRWDPKWNGLKNFKKFHKQGEQRGRPQTKVIVPLIPAKGKDYGLSDDRWLPGRHWVKKSTLKDPADRQSQSPTEAKLAQTRDRTSDNQFGLNSQLVAIESDSDEETGADVDNSELPDVMEIDRPSRSRKGKAAEKAGSQQGQAARKQQTQSRTAAATTTTTTTTAGTKRAARGPPAAEKAHKRRATRATKVARKEEDEEEDSEDGGLSFRFGKRK
ncbi:hypothetical protein BD289DRAFT_226845 [Coniella lustricola]|uniref:FHA domain-containing protein n=1 Tax=Coniella lustricola TaxID=2025994 RepID=A0A2T3AAM0_9PEZI|nr:hypothetical protein BD289DRAFT_226845 [Coniella lustricola]